MNPTCRLILRNFLLIFAMACVYRALKYGEVFFIGVAFAELAIRDLIEPVPFGKPTESKEGKNETHR